MPTVNETRYAHSDGFTDVCIDETGRYILTCGSDGDVRIWDTIDDDDAVSHKCGDQAFAIAIQDKRYFAASDANTVQAYTFPDGTPDGILTRFTAPANHIVLNKSGSLLIAGASDFSVKIVNVSNCSYKSCQGHEGPVLSLALDPKEHFLASSSCDGTVRIWKMEDRSQVHSMALIPKCSDISLSKTMCRMCWKKDGKLLYVPGNKEIRVYKRDSWDQVATLTDPCFTEHVSVVAISPDGVYLAAGAYDGWIAIFDLNSMKLVDKHRNERGFSVTSLAWNPKNNMELVFCDNQGQLGQLSDISVSEINQEEVAEDNKVAAGVFDDEDDDILIEATNDGNINDGNISEEDGVRIAKPTQAILSDDDDSNLDFPIKADDDNDAASMISEKSDVVKPEVRIEGYKPTPLQRPFQPGSTPQHLSSRFMMWNSVGIIRQYNNEEENSIDIEFHDTSIHHAMHIMNSQNYTMAALSTEAVLLATEADFDIPSKLMCMHFSSWDNNKEWSVSMSEGEEIQCVCLGEGWLAVVTDTRNVRVFSMAGVQKEVFTVPGPVLCMAGHTSQLMIVYHRGMGVPGDQCLGITVVDVRSWKRDLHAEPLPLSPKSTLTWTGFSAEGTPVYMDSCGILRMLNRTAGKNWTQVADMKSHGKSKSDHHWVVGIHENPQQIRCIPCKGSHYPATLPRPAPIVLPFQIPLCELNTEKSQYEELLWRTSLLSNHFDEWARQGYEVDETAQADNKKPAQEALMKLFALSARSEREFRALEVCEMMTDQHTLQLAIKYSSRMRYMQLAQRISEMAVHKAEEEQAKQYNDQIEDENRQCAGQTSHVRDYGNHGNEEEDAAHSKYDEDMDVEEVDDQSGPLLATKLRDEKQSRDSKKIFTARSNPFKVSSTPTQSSGIAKGTQVFDGLTKRKEKSSPMFSFDMKSPKAAQKKGSQPKLFVMKKKQENKMTAKPDATSQPEKKETPFDLWLGENKDRLREDNPDANNEDFSKYAAEQFRALTKEERQVWMKKSKEGKEKKENSGDTLADDNTENKKRKREDGDSEEVAKKLRDVDDDMIKKPLKQTTNSKLANFAFQKDES